MAEVLRPELSLTEARSTARGVPISVHSKRIMRHVILIGALVFFMFPIYYMVTSSVKTRLELFADPPTVLPQKPNFDGYVDLFVNRQFGLALRNSLIIVSVSVLLSVLLGTLAADGL